VIRNSSLHILVHRLRLYSRRLCTKAPSLRLFVAITLTLMATLRNSVAYGIAPTPLGSPSLVSVTVNPTSVISGATTSGTVTLSGAADPGGDIVTLSTNNPVVSVPQSVKVLAGQTTANFTVTTNGVGVQTPVVITGALSGVVKTATVTVNPAALISIALNPTTVQTGSSSVASVTLNGLASPTGSVVALSTNNSVASIPSSVTVPAGQTGATFTVSTSGAASVTTATISGTLNGQTQTATLTINPPPLASISLNPAYVVGGGSSTGTVTLVNPAGPSGSTVALSSNNGVATVPPSVAVASGKTTATFSITTTGVNASTTVTITGTLSGASQTATLTITPPTVTSLTLNKTTLTGGSSTSGTVVLTGPAGPLGAQVSLVTTNPAAIIPGSVTVPIGQSSATFPINTTSVAAQATATITASLNSTAQSSTLIVNPPVLTTFTLNPTTIAGINSCVGTLGLSGPAAPGGFMISLASNNPLVQIPPYASIPGGLATAIFSVSTKITSTPTIVTITASANGVTLTQRLTLTPIGPAAVSFAPSALPGGSASSGTVTLNGPASTGGIVVHLSSSATTVAVPASVTVPAGSLSVGFAAKTVAVAAQKPVTITAKTGAVSATGTLTVNPPTLASFAIAPSTVTGGVSATGTITLSGAAPVGGLIVGVTSNQGSAIVLKSVTVPAGKNTESFTVKTEPVAVSTIATVTVNLNEVSKPATLTIQPPSLVSLKLLPSSVIGGKSSVGTATINEAAPASGTIVTLSSNLGSATVPSSITIPAGKTSITFSVTTTKVSAKSTATISASAGGATKTAQLIVS